MLTVTRISTVSEIVRHDYRTADVFEKWGVDYCSNGNASLEEVCRQQRLDIAAVEEDLQKAAQIPCLACTLMYNEWPVEFLVDYITYVHHGYLKQAMPLLRQKLQLLIREQKPKTANLATVQEVFDDLHQALMAHVEQEEKSLFPYIKQINNTYKRKETYGSLFVRTLGKSLARVLATEHKRIAALLTALRQLTGDYCFPADACTCHQMIFHKLREFDAYLAEHNYLENDILFPKVMAMEKELLQL